MSSFLLSSARAGAHVGGHLGRLHDNLLDLSERLRGAVAQAVGDATAGAVRQAVLSLLRQSDAGPSLSRPRTSSPRRPASLWESLDDVDERDDPPSPRSSHAWDSSDEENEEEASCCQVDQAVDLSRLRPWPVPLSAALVAVAWWSQRQRSRRPLPAALSFSLACGLALYLGRSATGSATGLALTLLTDAVGAVAAALGHAETS